MWRTALVVLLGIHAAVGRAAAQEVPADSAARALKDSVLAAERRFLAQWDTAWMRSEHDRHQFSIFDDAATLDGSRHANYHCHPDFAGMRSAAAQGRLMQSTHGWFAVCPSFDLGDVRTPIDERVTLDQSLTDEFRPVIREARAALVAKFDTALTVLPADDLLAGQRIRFLVDQQEYDAALGAAHACRATSWWCAALAGYVHGARGEIVPADSAFAAAFEAMPRDERCAWNDYRLVIDFDSRDRYSDASCGQRDSVNARLWWLADPLFIEPGNERRVEQDVRTVLVTLRSAPGRDERYDWDPEVGNDARRSMIVRYGWPSYAFWGGPIQDRSHTGYLAGNRSPPNEPYTTYEYFGSRVHAIPLWAAVADPFHALPTDWSLTAAASHEPGPRRAAPAPSLHGPKAPLPFRPASPYWWPIEHFEPHRPLIQLPGGQQVFLRRRDGALLAVATDLAPDVVLRSQGESIEGITLVTSDAPGSVQIVGTVRGTVGSPVEVHGLVRSRGALAGVEYSGGNAKDVPGGRMRFGITPPLPLSAMSDGDIAISDPVILRAPAAGEILPNDPDAALARMATAREVNKAGRFGVYWETYGLKPSDPVEVAVWVERSTAQGIVRRLGIILGMATDLNTPVAISWKEPESAHRTHIASEGNVTVISRSVLIDASSLPAGEYALEVAVQRAGQDAVRGRTMFVVR